LIQQSGDKHLLNITGYHGISVLKPKGFMDNHMKKIQKANQSLHPTANSGAFFEMLFSA